MSRSGTATADRTPQDVATEMCVLGAIMSEPVAAFPIAAEILLADTAVGPTPFYLDGHQLTFRVMGELHDRGIPPDSVSLIDELRARDLLDKVGGTGVIMGMLNSVPTAANIEAHARKLADKAVLRRVIRACTESIERAQAQEDEPGVVIEALQGALMRLAPSGRGGGAQVVGELLAGRAAALDEALRQREELDAAGYHRQMVAGAGISTIFYDLDNLLGGLRPGLHVLLGRSSMGKSAMALSIARNVALLGRIPVGYLSLELMPADITDRLACMGTWRSSGSAWCSTEQVRQGRINPAQQLELKRSRAELAQAPLAIDHGAGLRIGEIKARLRALTLRHGARLLVVDHLHRIKAGQRDNRAQEVGEWIRELRDSAYALDAPLLLLAQTRRTKEDRRPEQSDGRDSGEIEEGSDTLTAVFRQNYFDKHVRTPGQPEDAELHILKNNSGPTGIARLGFIAEVARFINIAPKGQKQ
jgi:replicative DNA helicase